MWARTCVWNQTDPLGYPLPCFSQSVNEHFLNAHCVSGTVLGPQETMVNKAGKALTS